MPEPVDWAALRQVFEAPSKDGVAGHSEDMELLIELAEERVGIMMDVNVKLTDAVAYAYRDIPRKFWPKPDVRNSD